LRDAPQCVDALLLDKSLQENDAQHWVDVLFLLKGLQENDAQQCVYAALSI
jgi:hypothetical protein